jgi:hypothetical protein
MTRAYGYIYTIFGLETSHASLSEQALQLARAQWAGSGPRLANKDHCLDLSLEIKPPNM